MAPCAISAIVTSALSGAGAAVLGASPFWLLLRQETMSFCYFIGVLALHSQIDIIIKPSMPQIIGQRKPKQNDLQTILLM